MAIYGLIQNKTMTTIYGGDSEYIKKKKKDHRFYWGALIGFFFIVAVIYISNIKLLFGIPPYAQVSVVVFCLLFFKIVDILINKQEKGYFGANNSLRGEKEIYFELKNKLLDEFTVFQGLQINGNKWDIDFIVVGPTGIFTVEVKSHKGKIDFNGEELTHNGSPFKEKDILKQALSEAMELHGYILDRTDQDIFVSPIIVFSDSGAFVKLGLKKINNVQVIQKEWLLKLITEQPNANILSINKAKNAIESLFGNTQVKLL